MVTWCIIDHLLLIWRRSRLGHFELRQQFLSDKSYYVLQELLRLGKILHPTSF